MAIPKPSDHPMTVVLIELLNYFTAAKICNALRIYVAAHHPDRDLPNPESIERYERAGLPKGPPEIWWVPLQMLHASIYGNN